MGSSCSAPTAIADSPSTAAIVDLRGGSPQKILGCTPAPPNVLPTSKNPRFVPHTAYGIVASSRVPQQEDNSASESRSLFTILRDPNETGGDANVGDASNDSGKCFVKITDLRGGDGRGVRLLTKAEEVEMENQLNQLKCHTEANASLSATPPPPRIVVGNRSAATSPAHSTGGAAGLSHYGSPDDDATSRRTSLYSEVLQRSAGFLPSDDAWRSAERHDLEQFDDQMATFDTLRLVASSRPCSAASATSFFSATSAGQSQQSPHAAGSAVSAVRRPRLMVRTTCSLSSTSLPQLHAVPSSETPAAEAHRAPSPSSASAAASHKKLLEDIACGSELPLFVPLPPPIRAREEQLIRGPSDPMLRDPQFRALLMPRCRNIPIAQHH